MMASYLKIFTAKYVAAALVCCIFIFDGYSSHLGSTQSRLRILQENTESSSAISTVARVFEKWDRNASPFPCVSPESNDTQGIYYVKQPKASSTTSAHITERIAAREAKRQGYSYDCKTRDPMVHLPCKEDELNCGARDKDKSFLWTMIRHPSDRAVSQFGMNIDYDYYKDDEINDEFFKETLENNLVPPSIQLRYMANNENVWNQIAWRQKDELLPHRVATVLYEFNYVGIYERLLESLAVLSMLIDIPLSDVAFSRSSRPCDQLVSKRPSFLTDGMKEFLESSQWTDREKGDFMLYESVNKSLDMTIDKLGKEKVQEKVDTLRKLLSLKPQEEEGKDEKEGCGFHDLHSKLTPFADIHELPWFTQFSAADQEFVLNLEGATV